MKKLLLASLLTLGSFSSQADTLVGVYAGAHYWDTSAEGQFGGQNRLNDFDLKDEGKNSYWIAVEHFIPFVPNIKLRHNELDTVGNASVENLTIGPVTFDGALALDSELDHTDIILYYEILDNDLVNLDIGLNLKYADYAVHFNGEISTGDNSVSLDTFTQDYDGVIPLLYTNADIGIPGTDINLYADLSWINFDDSHAYDIQAGIKYRLIDNLAVDMDLQVGYRKIKVDVEDLGDIYMNAEWDGAFAGLEFHF